MTKPKVLVAGTLPAIWTVQHLLGAEVDYLPARSLNDALRALEARPDMILANPRFDESHMLELLQAARAHPATRETPFVCFRLAPMPAGWRRSLEAAVLALGAIAFVDLSALERDRGRDAAEKELRTVVLAHLPRDR